MSRVEYFLSPFYNQNLCEYMHLLYRQKKYVLISQYKHFHTVLTLEILTKRIKFKGLNRR
jgi:hypothetical protein